MRMTETQKDSNAENRTGRSFPSRLRASLRFCVSAFLCFGSLLGACRALQHRGPSGPTRADILMQVYPELQTGRFVVIADFEDPKHMDLFQLISVSEQAKCVWDRKGGRVETGAGGLRLTAGSSDDTIVIANRPDAQWYLKRDWRPYDLLLMSVNAPQRGLALDVVMASGPPEQRVSAQSSIALQRGWNGIRIDLAEVAEQIPLDDVREIRLAVSGVSKPVQVRLDDLLLTGNRVDLVGDSRSSNGALYVQQVGRRWNIGAGGRFELTFANGQITNGYNLAADPNRLRNLVQGTTLGPIPVVVGASGLALSLEGSELGDFSPLGKSVVARQRIVEMNAVRAVVASEWRFVDDPDAPLDTRPFQRWVYSIYPSGQVFVTVEATGRTKSWSPPGLGLAVTIASSGDDPWQTNISPAPVYATLRSQPRDTVLVYMLNPGSGSGPIVEQTDPQRRRVSLVAGPPSPGAPGEVVRWASQLVLGSSGEVADADAAARAVEYSQPAPIRVEVGSPVVLSLEGTGSASHRADGFDPSTGTYDLTPDQGRVRFVLDGRKRPFFSPAFRVLGAKDHEAWVYVNHLILSKVARDPAGNLVFQLPETIRQSTMVEVLFRRPGG